VQTNGVIDVAEGFARESDITGIVFNRETSIIFSPSRRTFMDYSHCPPNQSRGRIRAQFCLDQDVAAEPTEAFSRSSALHLLRQLNLCQPEIVYALHKSLKGI
jgi:hypothetical protein